LDIRESLSRLEDACLDRDLVDPFLDHASDIDSDQLDVFRQLVLIAVGPRCFIGKPNGSPLDDSAAMLLIITFERSS
jgi:hypothetical protein